MPVLALASTTLVVAGTAVLTWSGLEKIRDRSPLISTAAGLGLPQGLAVIAGTVVPIAELGTVATVVAGAPRYLSACLFAALGITFASSAVWSMLTGRVVACACFGASARKLGWFQVGTLPLWLLAGWAMTRLPSSGFDERGGIFAGGMFALAVVRAVPAIRLGIEARADRWASGGS
jgi:hypothetical protein